MGEQRKYRILSIVTLLTIIALISIALWLHTPIVYAEEYEPIAQAEQVQNEPSNLAEWFNNTAMPYIMNFATIVMGILVCLAPMIINEKQIKKNTLSMLKVNSKVLSDNVLLKAENKRYKKKIAHLEHRCEQIYKMLQVALMNNPNLVANGYAEQIADICKEEECEYEEREETSITQN